MTYLSPLGKLAIFRVLVVIVASLALSGCVIRLPGKSSSGLQVITNDTTASLFLDGQYLDKTPYIGKDIKPGTYNLKIQPDDPKLVPYETDVTLRTGLLTVLTWKPGERPETSGGVLYEMEPLKGTRKAELSFITIPDNAIISLDTREEAFSPLIVSDIEPGLHQLEITLPSYETQKHSINVIAGHRITITVKLAKATGEPIDSSAPSDADVTASPTLTSMSTTSGTQSKTSTPSARSRTGQTTSTKQVTITSTNFYQDGKEVLRVRDSASNAGKELGFAPVGSKYEYLGETTSGWHKISFNGQTGWVNAQYAQLSP